MHLYPTAPFLLAFLSIIYLCTYCKSIKANDYGMTFSSATLARLSSTSNSILSNNALDRNPQTTTVVKIVRLSKSTLSPDELTCSVRSKRRDQNQSDNRDIHDKLNPLYTLFTMINIFHDIYLSFSFLIFDYIFFHSVQFRIFTCSHYFVTLKSETFKGLLDNKGQIFKRSLT